MLLLYLPLPRLLSASAASFKQPASVLSGLFWPKDAPANMWRIDKQEDEDLQLQRADYEAKE